jgi:hypothetical protein
LNADPLAPSPRGDSAAGAESYFGNERDGEAFILPTMNQPSSTQLPQIVQIVLTQADKERRAGLISEAFYQRQLRRLAEEELAPRNLTLTIRELSDGRTRFLIKRSDSGKVCEIFDSGVRVASDTAGLVRRTVRHQLSSAVGELA